MCAEAVAVASAIGAGAESIQTVAVAAGDGRATPPCGNCRQIMSEFGVTWVVVENDDGDATVVSFGDVLPDSVASDRIVPPSQG
jgi:cytidine deaminase